MDQNDNDLQGSDGSGSLGGPDVRRRIPIKLISKQPLRSKPPTRPPRSTSSRPFKPPQGDEENFVFKQEEKFDCGAKAGDVFGSQRRFPQQLFWDYKLNLIGEKDDIPVHFCDKCGLPIHIYGRMIPCKHVFCYECALLHEKKGDKMCPGLTMYNCTDPVQRIEQSLRGALYMCSIVPGCKRTYLSQRDLQAHVNHRHLRAAKSSGPGGGGPREPGGLHLPPGGGVSSDVPERFRVPPPHLNKNHGHLPTPLKHGGGGGHGDPYGQGPPPGPGGPHDAGGPPSGGETFRISTVTTRQHSNLITVPIQDDSSAPGPQGPRGGGPNAEGPPGGPGGPPQGPPGPGQGQGQPPPPPQYPGQGPLPPHSHHMMAPPPQQHYGPPPPPPPQIMQHGPPQGPPAGPQQTGPPHMVYSQGGPPGHPGPPMSSAPPPITPPPGHIMSQMPPYMNHPPGPPPGPPQQHGPPNAGPPGPPPPHHYNPNNPMQQFSEDQGGQGTLSPPFSGGGLSPAPAGMGWPPAPRGPHPPPPGPPRMQGPPPPPPGPPQGQMPPGPPHHPDQSRYRPYYQ